jgi:hypothetical protein
MNGTLLVCKRLMTCLESKIQEKLTQINSRIESSISTQQIQSRFTVVTFAGLVNLGLR